MNRTTVSMLTVLCVAVALSGAAYAGTIHYEEDFGAGAANVSPDAVHWGAWHSATATDSSGTTIGTYVYRQLNDSDGGYFVLYNSAFGLETTVEPGVVSTGLLESISFLANHNSTSSLVRVAVRIGSDWYATNDTFSMSAAGSSSDWTNKAETHTFDWTNTNTEWLDLVFTTGTLDLKDTNPDSDLSGNVSEFGLYHDGDGTHMRVDDFTITVIPEPVSLALLLSGGLAAALCLVVRGSRRRRA